MSQDKLSPQVTVYVPADRNQSAPRDTAPFVVFFRSVTGPVVLFSFYFNPQCFFSSTAKKKKKSLWCNTLTLSLPLQWNYNIWNVFLFVKLYLVRTTECLNKAVIHPPDLSLSRPSHLNGKKKEHLASPPCADLLHQPFWQLKCPCAWLSPCWISISR